MRIKNVTIMAGVFDDLLGIIQNIEEPQSINKFANGCQLSFEKHSYLNRNNYLLVVLLLKHQSHTNISFICGGASTGMFIKFDWGTEIATIDNFFNEIELYLQSNEIEYEILDDTDCQ
jgi:hypothetical protein